MNVLDANQEALWLTKYTANKMNDTSKSGALISQSNRLQSNAGASTERGFDKSSEFSSIAAFLEAKNEIIRQERKDIEHAYKDE